jgi:hypothetical protein
VWKRWQFWLPLCLVAAVALAAIAIPLWQKRDYAIALNALAGESRAQAAVSDALRTELETKVGDYNFALEKKYAYPSAFHVVDELSRVLPDDTWLTQMEMKSIAKGKEAQREVLVRGETANAGRLVQLVEESSLFTQTAPRSQTTKIQPGTGEIFDLGAQLKPLTPPARVALVAVDKPVEPAPSAAATPAAPAAASGPSSAVKGPDAPPVPAPAPPAANASAPPVATGAPPATKVVPPGGVSDPLLSTPSAAPGPRPPRPPATLSTSPPTGLVPAPAANKGPATTGAPAKGSAAPEPVITGDED